MVLSEFLKSIFFSLSVEVKKSKILCLSVLMLFRAILLCYSGFDTLFTLEWSFIYIKDKKKPKIKTCSSFPLINEIRPLAYISTRISCTLAVALHKVQHYSIYITHYLKKSISLSSLCNLIHWISCSWFQSLLFKSEMQVWIFFFFHHEYSHSGHRSYFKRNFPATKYRVCKHHLHHLHDEIKELVEWKDRAH